MRRRFGVIHRGHARDRGFTYLELLFVVVILGILVAIALASFTIASARAEEAACGANQRALEDAVVEYQIDHAGEMPAALADVEPYVMALDAVDHCPSDPGCDLVLDADTGRVSCPNHPR